MSAPKSSPRDFDDKDRVIIRAMADAASVKGTKSSPLQKVPDPLNRKKS